MKIRCQYGQAVKTQCQQDATRKWGDHWFCEEHGTRQKVVSSDETPTPHTDGLSEQTVPARQHLIKSAGYWFGQSRLAQSAGQNAEAICCMENAYNHIENALAAAMDALQWMSDHRALIIFAEEPPHVTSFFEKCDRFFEINGRSVPLISASSSQSQVTRESKEAGSTESTDTRGSKEEGSSFERKPHH